MTDDVGGAFHSRPEHSGMSSAAPISEWLAAVFGSKRFFSVCLVITADCAAIGVIDVDVLLASRQNA
jgi:hypothetical protein